MKINKDYKNLAMGALGITGGQIAANLVGKQLDKLSFLPKAKDSTTETSPLIKGAIQGIAGVMIASKGKKNALVANAGLGMAASGVKNILKGVLPDSDWLAGVGNVAGDPFTYIGKSNDAPQEFNMAASSLGSVGANENGTWG